MTRHPYRVWLPGQYATRYQRSTRALLSPCAHWAWLFQPHTCHPGPLLTEHAADHKMCAREEEVLSVTLSCYSSNDPCGKQRSLAF